MLKLNESRVVFNAKDHTYTLDGVRLSGVTSMLSRRIFKDKYSGIPEAVLKKAAEHGTLVHEMCDMVDTLGAVPSDSEEAANYIKLKQEHGLVSVASEYLVSDNEHYASSIDAIYEGEHGGVVLNDRKTTSKLDMDYLSWQLSVYKHLFKLQNPDVEVEGLTATWLRGSVAKYVQVEEKPEELVLKLIEADINDEPFEEEPMVANSFNNRLDRIAELTERIKGLQSELAAEKVEVVKVMSEEGVTSLKTASAAFSYTPAHNVETFDMDAFKTAEPELFEKYQKEVQRKGVLTVRVK